MEPYDSMRFHAWKLHEIIVWNHMVPCMESHGRLMNLDPGSYAENDSCGTGSDRGIKNMKSHERKFRNVIPKIYGANSSLLGDSVIMVGKRA